MGRKKQIKNLIKEDAAGCVSASDAIKDDPLLPKKSLFRIDEVATYFSVTDRTIRLWIEHGHLQSEMIVGSVRIPRDSILHCRFNNVGNNIVL
jgi:excisionase family DNA binding protein